MLKIKCLMLSIDRTKYWNASIGYKSPTKVVDWTDLYSLSLSIITLLRRFSLCYWEGMCASSRQLTHTLAWGYHLSSITQSCWQFLNCRCSFLFLNRHHWRVSCYCWLLLVSWPHKLADDLFTGVATWLQAQSWVVQCPPIYPLQREHT